ncbi:MULTISPECIES: primosomal replication protein [unclassified Pseudoalteromonas]|uniref:primosomal replication protein n=1 Tax=unclassified Pseudoalteromonas TaxID=194690 RepID=UPI000CF661E2|nr:MULTISPECIES: primosomal replication protein [unclassified Pseudoalteromonas]MBS3798628.1 primosomal replication protein [Pseudoalteromonas sp. BDTF-M6]
MTRGDALTRLKHTVQRLRADAEQFDKAKWFAKNRYMQAQHTLFERSVFNTRSMQLVDYVDEVEQQLERLSHSQFQGARHQYAFALTQLSEQIEAIVKVLKATPVWEKENTPSARARKYQKAVQQIIQPTNELYQELAKNHEFERRLEQMINERQQQLHLAKGEQATLLNKEILALHARLGRCRKAIGACEERIQYAEKQQQR